MEDYLRKQIADSNKTLDNVYERKFPLDEMANAFNSVYYINKISLYTGTYENKSILVEDPSVGGSCLLFEGGYILTAGHVTSASQTIKHDKYGQLELISNSYDLYGGACVRNGFRIGIIEKVFECIQDDTEYCLLKLDKKYNLTYYKSGINTPTEIKVGMHTVAIGFPLSMGKSIRLGNISQVESDQGINYLTYKNNVLPGDSGGPLFVIEDGKLKLAALNSAIVNPNSKDNFAADINYGIKYTSIIDDMKKQLESGRLDANTAALLQNFLDLNVK